MVPVLKCQICGKEFEWYLNLSYDGRVCSRWCWEELDWRRTLMILKKDYYPDPKGHNESRPV